MADVIKRRAGRLRRTALAHRVSDYSRRIMASSYRTVLARYVRRRFFMDLIAATENFSRISWLGHPIWQNIFDLWTIQETLYEIQPDLLIECGTNRGGSALFYANLFDLLGKGSVITIDVRKLQDISHQRIMFLEGSSTAPEIIEQVSMAVGRATGHVMVILDSDHSAGHVGRELSLFSRFVTPGSFILVQDGVIDLLPSLRADRPGPLHAIRDFLHSHPDFYADLSKSNRFLITHHPMGWLRRKPVALQETKFR
jgi:cephalosporin hydroxylase